MAEKTGTSRKIKTEVWAHRGASGWDRQYAPENTMPSFIKAVEMGADGIEFDVQMTKDGELVICHDERIDRTARGHGYIKDFTLAELKKIDFGKPHVEYGFVEIPTLEEVLQYTQRLDIKLNIELKTGIVYYDKLEEKTVDMVRNFGMEDRVIYSSFNYYSLAKLHSYAPQARIGMLMHGDYVRIPEDTSRLGVLAVHPPVGLMTREYVDQCHANNIKVHTWVVDNPVAMREMIEIGADAFITDCPDNGKRVFTEWECNKSDNK
ncbi:glycerophosphodiester phosphodiesterase [Selenomonas ruminantium]|uniref:Glycerophosphoryl diester phosphodiesterase n=1 Tax=Selenomonas ruminantium TaxID=971 RepID=A0A1I0YJX9_SELRU|nr:glycerophosphodiester phosphodiesterase [Selenomonas ruminantium]SFB13689.1 glycerophosphoryl diester phosphodiesterase [Selenomonas ruminantium]